MATPFDPASVFPPFYDPAELVYPWSTPPAPPVVDPAAVAAPPVAPAPEPAPPPVGAAPLIPPPPAAEVPAFVPPPPVDTLPSMRDQLPAPPVDATTGAAPLPEAAQQKLAGELAYAGQAQKLAESPFDPKTGDIRADVSDADASRYFDELRQRDPQGYVEMRTKFEDLKTKHALAQREKIVEQDWQQQQDNRKIRDVALADARKKSERIEADAQKLFETKLDPTVGGIAPILMGIIGGLIQGRTGSATNSGIEALKGVIAQRFEVQKANLANQREGLAMRRSALAGEQARIGDDFHNAEVFRLASLKHADDVLATEQLKYAPRGTTFLRIADARGQVAAEMQKSREARDQKLFENSLKLQDAARQQQIADESRRHNRASEYLQGKELTDRAAERQFQRDIHRQDKADAAAAKAQEQHDKQVLERSFGGEITTDANGNQVVGPLTMKDGSVFIAKGPEGHVNALRKKHDAAVTLERTLNEIRRIGPEWLSDTANSDKLQRLKQLAGDARLQAIAAKDLGVPTGHDIELADTFIGTTDATRRKDSMAGLVQARASLIRDHNAELQNAGLDKPWNPPDTSTLPSEPATFKPTATEQGAAATPGPLAKALFTPLGVEHGSALDPAARAEEGASVGPTGLAREDNTRVLDAIKSASKATPADRAALVDTLAAWAQSPRESVATGVLGLLRGESPALYGEVLAKLPEDRRDAIPDFSGLPGSNLPPLPPRKGAK